MKFDEAIREVTQGKKITKQEWGNFEIYGLIKDGILHLHKADGAFYHWTISDGDLKGEDWIVLENKVN